MFFGQPPSDADRMEYEADIAAVHNWLSTLDYDGLYALSIVLSGCISQDTGFKRALQMHGEVKAIARTKFDLCWCGSKHRTTEHGHTTNLYDYDPAVLAAYEVNHPSRSVATVVCNQCNCSYESLDTRMNRSECHCGAGPDSTKEMDTDG